jgi:hypothetical protein
MRVEDAGPTAVLHFSRAEIRHNLSASVERLLSFYNKRMKWQFAHVTKLAHVLLRYALPLEGVVIDAILQRRTSPIYHDEIVTIRGAHIQTRRGPAYGRLCWDERPLVLEFSIVDGTSRGFLAFLHELVHLAEVLGGGQPDRSEPGEVRVHAIASALASEVLDGVKTLSHAS